jgi:hypothetical protein
MKIRQVGTELFHEDRRTDRRKEGNRDRHDETNSRFRNIVNAPENEKVDVNAIQVFFFSLV